MYDSLLSDVAAWRWLGFNFCGFELGYFLDLALVLSGLCGGLRLRGACYFRPSFDLFLRGGHVQHLRVFHALLQRHVRWPLDDFQVVPHRMLLVLVGLVLHDYET